MTGKGVREYLKRVCDDLDAVSGATMRRAATLVVVPAALGFTTACYAVGWDEDIPYGGEPEVCTNGIDDDYDGFTDCFDTDCSRLELCLGCDDGLDNDGDGLADCSDPDCRDVAPCASETDCANGMDDDSDGLPDCVDDDCAGREVCMDCDDGVDNDGNGLTDCDDDSCAGHPACADGSEICGNGVDDDGDGYIDCTDPDCYHDDYCY